MKCSDIQSFEKQLRAQVPEFRTPIIISIKDPFERKYYVDKCVAFIRHFHQGIYVDFVSDEKAFAEKIAFGSLFGQKEILVIQDIKFRELQETKERVCIWSVDDKVSLPSDSSYVVCDLQGEAPWNAKKRLMLEGQKIAKKYKKSIETPTMEMLMSYTQANFAMLKNEIEKLCVYIGKRTQINAEDVQQLTLCQNEQNLWQVSEALVYDSSPYKIKQPEFTDLSAWLAFLGQMRYQINTALCLKDHLKNHTKMTMNGKKSAWDIKKQKVQKKTKQTLAQMARQLFAIEILSKNTSFQPKLFWDWMIIRFSSL